MISEQKLRELVEAYIADSDSFLVDLRIHPGNKIVVEVEGHVSSTSIEDCVRVSRFIEHDLLDRNEEDFSLEVASPGLTNPFKVKQQYNKNVGRDVKVKCNDGATIKGKLYAVKGEEIQIITREKERVEGRKKKEWTEISHFLKMEEIKETKIVIPF